MILKVPAVKYLKGRIQLPGSKSYSIRAFMIAACGGRSTIIHPSDCDDALVALQVASALGSQIHRVGNNIWEIRAGERRVSSSRIHVGESGTVLRFVLPLLSLQNRRWVVEGKGTLQGRPNDHLTRTLRSMGVDIRGVGERESIPIIIKSGRIHGGKIKIDGSLSSQFVSALLITAPQLKDDTTLTIQGKKMVSLDYIAMTRQVLQKSGIKIFLRNKRTFYIKGNQRFGGLKNFSIPSDYGLAAFHMAAAALVPSDVTLLGSLKNDLIQADGRILEFLRKMGVEFLKTAHSIKIKGPFTIKGGIFSLKDSPDLVPIMTVLALFADRKTKIVDIHHARVKESDRISDLRHELLRIGAKIKETDSGLMIEPQKKYKSNCLLDPHRDHRLAMAFAVLGLKVSVHVKDIECCSKSYPRFVADFKKLGIPASRI